MATEVLLAVAALAAAGVMVSTASGPFNIAHRGASAYAPEHTAAAYELALEMGADYVEPDLGITKDGILVVSHDPSLERTTDVEERFPDRFSMTIVDGKPTKVWWIEDFTLAEIKTLDKGSWFDAKFAGQKVLTFQEAITLVRGKAGIFPELKTPGRVRAKGFDMEQAVANLLEKNQMVGTTFEDRPEVYLQSFEEDSLRRLATLLPTVPRTFLIGTPEDGARWLTAAGLKEARAFATAVSPSKRLILADPAIVTRAHAAGLIVVPYTFQEADEMRRFVHEFKVDGLFTDNPDRFPR
ncbi:MAG: glycerophosphodiester phosphodiesterase family protein [Acidobacteriota bacterium]